MGIFLSLLKSVADKEQGDVMSFEKIKKGVEQMGDYLAESDLVEKVMRILGSGFMTNEETAKEYAKTIIAAVREYDGFKPVDTAPYDEYVLLKVDSGMRSTPYDYVYARRHSDGYKSRAWLNVQNDHITERHVGEIYGWRRMEEVGDE